MTALGPRRLFGQRNPTTPLVVLAIVGGLLIGTLTAYRAQLGVLALVIAVVLSLVIRRPANLGVLALIGVFAAQRVGSTSPSPGSEGGISYSDLLLAAATVMALPALAGTKESSRLRVAFLGLAAYLACLVPSMVLHASTTASLEWLHRLVLIGGSLLVGAWIASSGVVTTALRWLAFVGCGWAVLSVSNTLSNGLRPATPLGLNKNFVGALLCAILIITITVPSYVGLSARVHRVVMVVLALGLIASQSRGSMLAAVAGVLVAVILMPQGQTRRARGLTMLVAIVLAVVSFISIRDQLTQTQQDLNNGSLGVRFNVERVTRDIWQTSPVVGVGLKYFKTTRFGPFAVASNNAVDNELAEAGVIGLMGFLVMQGTVVGVGVRRRRDNRLIAVGAGCVMAALLHGMVDIYWTAGSITLPFVIMGMALASPREFDPDPSQATGRHQRAMATP